MARAVRVLSRLQLSPEELARVSRKARPADAPAPDLVFYTGCNVLRTPHIVLLCLDILDRLDVNYEVYGGPSDCCGIIQMRVGDAPNAGRQGERTVDRFFGTGAPEVLAWCPTCQIQFGETAIPAYREITGTTLDMTMFPVWLAGQLDRLRPMMTKRVEKRVSLFEYAGELGVMEAVRALLGAVPGLEIVEIETSAIGYTGTASVQLGGYLNDTIDAAYKEAEAADVDAFVGIYHSDHRRFAGQESDWPFTMQNYMELLGESMGFAREDRFKALKLMADADAIVAASAGMIAEHGLNAEDVRDTVVKDLLVG